METEEALRFCRGWLAAWTGNRPEELIAFYDPGAFYADPARREGLRGHPEILPYFRKLLARNPDWTWEPREVVPTARGFLLKWRARIPTDGRTVEVEGVDLLELSGGKIVRNEVFFDRTALGLPPRT